MEDDNDYIFIFKNIITWTIKQINKLRIVFLIPVNNKSKYNNPGAKRKIFILIDTATL